MTLRHGSYVSVCRIDRVPVLTLVSKYVEGVRLSDLLRVAHQRNVTIDIAIVMAIVRQLLAATALLHEHAPDVANGLIAPERLILAPQSRIRRFAQRSSNCTTAPNNCGASCGSPSVLLLERYGSVTEPIS